LQRRKTSRNRGTPLFPVEPRKEYSEKKQVVIKIELNLEFLLEVECNMCNRLMILGSENGSSRRKTIICPKCKHCINITIKDRNDINK
jgi:hypothetical protein